MEVTAGLQAMNQLNNLVTVTAFLAVKKGKRNEEKLKAETPAPKMTQVVRWEK